MKGAASDAIAQLHVEKNDRFDWKRNVAFGFFSGAWLGIGQHFVYNVAFSRMFGKGTDFISGIKKVVADSTIRKASRMHPMRRSPSFKWLP